MWFPCCLWVAVDEVDLFIGEFVYVFGDEVPDLVTYFFLG